MSSQSQAEFYTNGHALMKRTTGAPIKEAVFHSTERAERAARIFNAYPEILAAAEYAMAPPSGLPQLLAHLENSGFGDGALGQLDVMISKFIAAVQKAEGVVS